MLYGITSQIIKRTVKQSKQYGAFKKVNGMQDDISLSGDTQQ